MWKIDTNRATQCSHAQANHTQTASPKNVELNCSLFLLFQTVLSRAPSRKVQQKYIWQKRTWKTWWWRDHKLLGSGYRVQLCRCLGFKPAEMLPPSSNQMKQSEEVGRGYSNKFPTDLHRGSAAYRITKKVSAKQENNSQTLLIHTQPFISLKIQKHSKSLCSQKGPEAQLKVGQVAWGKPQLLTQEQLCQSITAGSVPKAVGQALKIENGWRYRQKITWDTKQGSKWRPNYSKANALHRASPPAKAMCLTNRRRVHSQLSSGTKAPVRGNASLCLMTAKSTNAQEECTRMGSK